jgi:hypothetical protein
MSKVIKKQILHFVQEILRLTTPNLHRMDEDPSMGTPVKDVWGPVHSE